MSNKPHLSRAVLMVSAVVSLALAYCPSTYAAGERSEVGAAPRYLFICAGDQARNLGQRAVVFSAIDHPFLDNRDLMGDAVPFTD